ncbi:MAG: MliC family protein [Cellvibrionales bacterium]|nr:MliC family protein [Cellvibrionales bacterium]
MKALIGCLVFVLLAACEKSSDELHLDALPNEMHFNCEKVGLVTVKFVPSESAILMLPDQTIELAAEPVASGFKYVKSDIVLQGKGNLVTLTIGIQPPFKCTPQVIAQVDTEDKR